MSEKKLSKLKELLQTLIEKGFIVPSSLPIAAPVFFVEKKGTEDLRLVIDYRELNKITIKDDYPIPRVHDLIDRLGKAQWFSKLDLTSGYYQVQVAESDQWKTTFRTRYGTFHFRVTPFGLAGAPSTFQRLMQNTFMKELDEYVVVYLDDVLIYSKTKELHYDHLKNVLQRMRDARLFVGLSKCELVTQIVQYLGFVIEPGGVGPDPEKVEAVQRWPLELLDRKQLRGFLGLVGYYRRLITNFNKWAHPLHELLRKESDMTWWPKHTEAVQRLKDALAAVTLLKIYDPDKELTLKTDASKHAIGSVLEQDGHPIAFESKTLGPGEQFIPAYESDLLAIVYALMKWKKLIGTKKVRIETDHATLGRMLTQKNVTPRLGYWLAKLADSDIEVVYK
ncbi:retrotransposon ty3-gypsy subclass, partial [Cystoisospora suis]